MSRFTTSNIKKLDEADELYKKIEELNALIEIIQKESEA